MFSQLCAIAKGGEVAFSIKPVANSDGRFTVVVQPRPDATTEPALNTALALTGTEAELNDEFIGALTTYQVAWAGLKEQADATAEVLAAARAASSGKAAKAIQGATGPKKAALPAPAGKAAPQVNDGDEEEQDGGDGDEGHEEVGTGAAVASRSQGAETINLFGE